MAPSVVHHSKPEMKNPFRVFRMIEWSVFSMLFGVQYLIVGMWKMFLIYVVASVSGHVMFVVFWVEFAGYRRVCCYGDSGFTETDYARGGSCTDTMSLMYRSGAVGTCGTMPVIQIVLLSVSLGAYCVCFYIWMFLSHWYMRHVYEQFADIETLVVETPDHLRVKRLMRMFELIQLIPDTGILFGRHEAYLLRGGLHRQRVVAWVLNGIVAPIFALHCVQNYTWACYKNYAWGTLGDMSMLMYGMCTYTGMELFSGGVRHPDIEWKEIWSLVWPRTVLFGVVSLCTIGYQLLLVWGRYSGIRIRGWVFIQRYEDACLHTIRIYCGLQMHLSPADMNPFMSVLEHGTGHDGTTRRSASKSA